MTWATVSSQPCFCWLYRASLSLAAKNIINLISILTIWWSPCAESSLVLLEEGICNDQCLQNSPSQASTVCELWTSRCSSWILKRQRNQRSDCQHPLDHRKQESSRKTSVSALLTMPKPLTVWITINCGKFWKRWEYQTNWPASWEICRQVRKQQLELDTEQQTGSK